MRDDQRASVQAVDQIADLLDSHGALDNEFFRVDLHRPWSQANRVRFAREYYHLSARFPDVLRLLVERVEEPEAREFLHDIWSSEMGEGCGGTAHADILMGFFESIGLPPNEVAGGPTRSETRALLEGLQELFCDDVSAAVGAEYAFECHAMTMIEELDQWARSVLDAPAADLRYFDIHLVAEEQHQRLMAETLSAYAGTAEDRAAALRGAWRCLDLLADFWSGLHTAVAAS